MYVFAIELLNQEQFIRRVVQQQLRRKERHTIQTMAGWLVGLSAFLQLCNWACAGKACWLEIRGREKELIFLYISRA